MCNSTHLTVGACVRIAIVIEGGRNCRLLALSRSLASSTYTTETRVRNLGKEGFQQLFYDVQHQLARVPECLTFYILRERDVSVLSRTKAILKNFRRSIVSFIL